MKQLLILIELIMIISTGVQAKNTKCFIWADNRIWMDYELYDLTDEKIKILKESV